MLPRPPLRAAPEEIPLDVLYEDEDFVVVNKPAGMVVHAGAGAAQGTLVNALLHHFGTLSSGRTLRPGIVHRLDRGTSGAMVVARNDAAHRALAEQFRARTVQQDIYRSASRAPGARCRNDRAADRARSAAPHAHDRAARGMAAPPRPTGACCCAWGISRWSRPSRAPGARTRFARISPPRAIRWWATRSTARRGRLGPEAFLLRRWGACFCTRLACVSRIRVQAQPSKCERRSIRGLREYLDELARAADAERAKG